MFRNPCNNLWYIAGGNCGSCDDILPAQVQDQYGGGGEDYELDDEIITTCKSL